MISFTEDTDKIHNFNDNALLVFIDETGHEKLSDKNYPIFHAFWRDITMIEKEFIKSGAKAQ